MTDSISGKVFQDVVKVVSDYAADKKASANISEETTLLADLRINSARMVDIVLDIEDLFNISVSDEQLDALRTVGDACRVVEATLASP